MAIPQRHVTIEQLRQFAEAIGLNRAAPDRCSWMFMFEVYCCALAPGLRGDPNKIVAEVRSLEGLRNSVGTKPPDQFKHPPLRGLWKKHYLMNGIPAVATNVRIGFGRKKKRLNKIISEHWNPATAHLPKEVIAKNVADAVMGLYTERSHQQRLTGEWIIFARHEEQNYYLCLASHGEPDAQIFERVKWSIFEGFSFLRSQLNLA